MIEKTTFSSKNIATFGSIKTEIKLFCLFKEWAVAWGQEVALVLLQEFPTPFPLTSFIVSTPFPPPHPPHPPPHPKDNGYNVNFNFQYVLSSLPCVLAVEDEGQV